MGSPPQDADAVAMSDAFNGICAAIASLNKVTEEARPWAILTHLELVRESLAGVLVRTHAAQRDGYRAEDISVDESLCGETPFDRPTQNDSSQEGSTDG